MDDYYKGKKSGGSTEGVVEEEEMRKGAWSVEEDTILINYVATHGHARWNSLARSSGLKRSGKSCRLRWLNYLRPDVRRGNITLQEQITILHLHSRWGNRWSKIAEQLPGRTDNEIKNYWRTKVVKQAKQLKCDVSSDKFRDALRYVLIPLLLERLNPHSQMGPSPIQNEAQAHVHQQTSTNSSVDQLQQLIVHSDSGHSICSSFNGQMFQCTNLPFDVDGGGAGDLWMESLWNDDSIYGFSPTFR